MPLVEAPRCVEAGKGGEPDARHSRARRRSSAPGRADRRRAPCPASSSLTMNQRRCAPRGPPPLASTTTDATSPVVAIGGEEQVLRVVVAGQDIRRAPCPPWSRTAGRNSSVSNNSARAARRCRRARLAGSRRSRSSSARSRLVVDEPLLGQRVERAVGLERGDAGVDRRDKVGALGEDEAELLRRSGSPIIFSLPPDAVDIAPCRPRCRSARGRRRRTSAPATVAREGLEQLDARVLFVAVEHVVDGDVERRGAGLRADQKLRRRRRSSSASVKRLSSPRTSMKISERM